MTRRYFATEAAANRAISKAKRTYAGAVALMIARTVEAPGNRWEVRTSTPEGVVVILFEDE